MNDDELDNLFSVNEDEQSVEDTAETVSEEKDTDEISAEDFASGSDAEEEIEKAPAVKKESSHDTKEDKKAQRAAEREKAMKAAEKYLEQIKAKKRAERKAKREERLKKRSELPPLKERTYLDDFPLSFKTTILVLIGLVILAAGILVAFHPMFRIDNFIIEGNHALSEERLMEITGLDYNDHVFQVLAVNRSSIKAHNPYIYDIDITFTIPSTVHITVQERQKIAYIKTPDGYFAVDAEGTVLEFSSQPSEDAHPLLCGLELDRVVLGEKIDLENNYQFQKMIIVLGAVLDADADSLDDGYSFFESVQEIRLVPSGYFFMTVTLPNGSTLLVKLSELEKVSDDMHWLMFVIQEGKLNDFPDGVLDMTDEDPIYGQYDY
ncbi:Cell division septal protein FtsQ [Ruminococcaceae bacterium KH2T8]|nr:Cell division septal protein FtsQ [Ruminococcaceae bacterium KH2T8]